MKFSRNILLSGFACLTLTLGAVPFRPSVLDIKQSITDSTIVYPESFETDTRKLLESWYMRNYTTADNNYSASDDPVTSDEVIISRLKALPTVVEMPFNQVVRSYIDRYTKQGRSQVAAILGLSLYYLPIFEQALEAEGLPLELKYLPMIESGLDPNAVSKHGATGLWQFMLETGKGLGLDVNSLVDERRDPYMSSEKAAAFLKDLYQAYGDWSLAIAAYNCGPGTLNKAIRRAGGDPASHDFWSIYNYLPAETRGYVPMFIAANYVMNYYPDHNISPVLPTKPFVTDTVEIRDHIHFNQISQILDIPIEELRLLNPQYRRDIIPATSDKPYMLTLPSQQVHAYILSEDAIKNLDSSKYAQRETVEPGISTAESLTIENSSTTESSELAEVEAAAASRNKLTAVSHKVSAGESLASIAAAYGVTQADIKRWNHLRRNAVRTGQQLRIMTANPEAAIAQGAIIDTSTQSSSADDNQTVAATTSVPNKTPASSSAKKTNTAKTTTHTIKSGESLSTIARKYGTTVDALKKANNLTSDNIRAGKTLKIPAKTTTPTKKKTSRKKKR